MNDSSSLLDLFNLDPNILKVQILAYDSYQCLPSRLDQQLFTINGKQHRNFKFRQVPILRIFGRFPTGQTCVLHLHNVFPYLFIPYDGPASKSQSIIDQYLIKVFNEIERKLKLSFENSRGMKRNKKFTKRNRGGNSSDGEEEDTDDDESHTEPDDLSSTDDDNKNDDNPDNNNGNISATISNYIADISLVKGIPFYGYNVGHHPFIKISLLSPKYIVRLTRLLHEGKIFGKAMQPFESHISYTLQFLTDYNCYSSDWISLNKFYWRSPMIMLDGDLNSGDDFWSGSFQTDFAEFNQIKINDDLKSFLKNYVTVNNYFANVLDSDKYPRMARTLLELDSSACFVLNRKEIEERDIHKGFNEFDDPKLQGKIEQERYINSTKSLLADVNYIRKLNGLPDDPKLKLFEGDDRSFKGINWIEIDELKKQLNYCIDQSNKHFLKQHPFKSLNSKTVIGKRDWLDGYPTVFQSINRNWYRLCVPESELIQVGETQIRNQEALLEWVLVGMRESQKEESFAQTHTVSFGKSLESISILSSVKETTEKLPQDVVHSSSDSDLDTEDDNDDFIGSIPHVEVEKEYSQLRENSVGAANMTMSSNNLDSSAFEELEAQLEMEADQGVDEKLFQMTQKEKRVSFSTTELSCSQFQNIKPTTTQKTSQTVLYVPDDILPNEDLYELDFDPPEFESHRAMLKNFEDNNMVKIEYDDPFYSKRDNTVERPFYFAGKKFQPKIRDLKGIPNYETTIGTYHSYNVKFNTTARYKEYEWTYIVNPPSYDEVAKWCNANPTEMKTRSQVMKSQIEMATQRFKGYLYPSLQTPVSRKATNYNKLVLLNMEIHVNTRDQLFPDPLKDEINAIFWKFDKNACANDLGIVNSGVLLLDKQGVKKWSNLTSLPVEVFNDEKKMLTELTSLVELIDPDILSGYEIHNGSWGYIIERCKKVFNIDFIQRISRVVSKYNNKFGDRWGYTHASAIKVTGRHMLNLWRKMKNDTKLNKYSLENVVFHVLHKRIPHFDYATLTRWFTSDDARHNSLVLGYFTNRMKYESKLIDQLELVERTTEESRLIGIDYYSVIYRGSQFKIESFLVRTAKPENFVMISPSKKQVFKQDPLQCIALILEPESAFYKSPLVVLDFQSLYPSVMIAYNYCYSTLLGRLRGFNPHVFQKMGVTSLKLPPGILKLLEEHINISPNGLMFVKPDVRLSLMAKYLTEILDARLLVKSTMSKLRDDYELQKLYNNRQLALKLIANVTYGYTAASFSGRMPNSDIADAIVSSSRETLLKAISEIENNEKWGARVVYGDTDSLFVYLPGKTKQEAFEIGRAMAAHITQLNPAPIKLKFEKVYFPSVLLSKKRYVGYSYEYEDQKEPKFDAKGIETVRRDGIPAQQKMVEKSLRLLFETRDLSKVRSYVTDQFQKLMMNKVNVKDFCFGKAVKLGAYKNEKYIPPGARLSMEKANADIRSAPQYKERVFYLVKKGSKGQILREKCITPLDFVKTENMEIDSDYYINKVLIAPLERIFSLVGADVKAWYDNMPKSLTFNNLQRTDLRTLVVRSSICLNCGKLMDTIKTKNNSKARLLCNLCSSNELKTLLDIQQRVKTIQKDFDDVVLVCKACTKTNVESNSLALETAFSCSSEDCPIFYDRIKQERKVRDLSENYKDILGW